MADADGAVGHDEHESGPLTSKEAHAAQSAASLPPSRPSMPWPDPWARHAGQSRGACGPQGAWTHASANANGSTGATVIGSRSTPSGFS